MIDTPEPFPGFLDMNTRRPALFLDRDGIVNRDGGYLHRIQDIVFRPGVVDAVARANRAGWWVFVVTNQSGVARGRYDEEAVLRLHAWMARHLAARGARVDAWRHCPHHPEGVRPVYARVCACRKPAPGMLVDLMGRFRVDAAASHLLGDAPRDVAAATAVGVTGHLVAADGELDRLVANLVAGLP
ncbi:MAG: HAD family hydrolase [Azospirillaceae bacterium]